MALTFPMAMPTDGVADQKFEPLRVDYISPQLSGRISGVAAGFPLWRGEWSLGAMGDTAADAWRAFHASLRGPQRLFYGRDLARTRPRAYRAGYPGGFGGDAGGWSVNGDRDVLTLTGLPAGFVVSLGDLVGFRWTTSGAQRRALVRCVEAAVASGGGSASFTIEPALPTVVPASGVTAYLEAPTCLMRMVPGESELGALDALHSIGGRIVGIQELLP